MLSREELLRYSRHLSLEEVGRHGQEKLKKSSVLVIGAGGLGCPILQYLSAAGIGRIGIVDFDTIDISNLQRQVLYTTADTGKNKAETAALRLSANNPHIQFETHNFAIDVNNAIELISNYDIVLDGSDNFSTRYLVNDACVLLNKPLVFGSIFKFDGQVTVFNYTDSKGNRGPTYRCLYPEPPAPGEMPSCSEIGVLGVLPGIIGTLQANEALKIILGTGNPLSGKLFTIDALSMKTALYDIEVNPENQNIQTLGDYDYNCKTSHLINEHISVKELKKLIESNADLFLLDVREAFEYDMCKIEGAVLIPMNSIPQHTKKLPKNTLIIVYCHHGMRSASIVEYLKLQGFNNVCNLKGGIHAWAKEIDHTLVTY